MSACSLLLVVALPVSQAAAQKGGVTQTRHNLSVSGPGEIKSTTETEICKFCHIPHNAVVQAPLWGHALSRADYVTAPIKGPAGAPARAPQPDGSSRLCLSCHDGTVALGAVAGSSRPIPMSGGGRLTAGKSLIGTDLSGSHPISFVVAESQGRFRPEDDLGLRPIGAINADHDVRLDRDGKMQCSTCHDPHSDAYYVPGKVPHFWVKPTLDGVCQTCHELR